MMSDDSEYRSSARGRPPHRLWLYQQAVQHPEAEVRFMLRAHQHHRRSRGAAPATEPATLLREDFAGTCAVAAAWVACGPDHQAMAVEHHGPTLRWAAKQTTRLLGDRAADLHLVESDVMAVSGPRVDVIAALNFSVLIYHDRASLKTYLRHARRNLRPGGILVVDVYGGRGALKPGTQWCTVQPTQGQAFEYGWEQRSHDAASERVDCRIHFKGAQGWTRRDAFRYDWRLWSLPELVELMLEAGFAQAQVWAEDQTPSTRGRYRPVRRLENREDWVAYVVGRR